MLCVHYISIKKSQWSHINEEVIRDCFPRRWYKAFECTNFISRFFPKTAFRGVLSLVDWFYFSWGETITATNSSSWHSLSALLCAWYIKRWPPDSVIEAAPTLPTLPHRFALEALQRLWVQCIKLQGAHPRDCTWESRDTLKVNEWTLVI